MNRRAFLTSSVGLGIAGLATGIPPMWLRAGIPTARAATGRVATPLILSMSQEGDPVNANAPGSWAASSVNHPADPDFVATNVMFGSQSVLSGAVWGTLPADLRSRMAFIHHRTFEVVHGGFDRVLRANDAVVSRVGPGPESLPSAIAQETAVAIGAVQEVPVCLGPETVDFDGRRLSAVTPRAIVSLFANQNAVLNDLRPIRRKVLDKVYGEVRSNGTAAQRAFLDEIATSRELAHDLGQGLAALLEDFDQNSDDNGPHDQIRVAVALAAQKMAPVITVNIPFGADNHVDPDFLEEVEQTETGIAHVIDLWDRLGDLGLRDSVSIGMLNVFGRTLERFNGRDHNPDHNVMWMAGPNVVGGVVGGMNQARQAMAFDAKTGAVTEKGGVPVSDGLPVTAATLMAACGVEDARIAARLPGFAPATPVLIK